MHSGRNWTYSESSRGQIEIDVTYGFYVPFERQPFQPFLTVLAASRMLALRQTRDFPARPMASDRVKS